MINLNNTLLVVRERTFTELCDLSLHIIRQLFKPLLIAALWAWFLVRCLIIGGSRSCRWIVSAIPSCICFCWSCSDGGNGHWRQPR